MDIIPRYTMQSNNKRIAKNTLMLYFRMILIMGVTLYTSRVVLNVLGVEDFGIYNVVGGVVAMFSLLTGSLRTAAQRYITYELGKTENQQVERIFSATVTVHVVLALIVLLLAECVGVWFLNTQMNIAPDRMNAANWVFQFSMFAFVVNLLSVPFNAAIIAYEKMSIFAYISILEVSLKLFIVFALQWFGFDKLKLYALLVFIVSGIIQLIYQTYCKRHFSECRFRFRWDKSLFKEMFSFAGWNFIGMGSWVLMTQGVNILLNIFFNVTVNAARGIANQIQTAVTVLITNFMTALNPQITKSYASGDNDYLQMLLCKGARFSFLLMFLLSLPILMETQTVLFIWLKQVPEYTVIFVRLSIIFALIHSLSNTLITAQLATGRIKRYQIIAGGLQMLNFPLSFIALKWGASPVVIYIILILLEICILIARILLLRGMIQFQTMRFVKEVLVKALIVSVLSAIIPFLMIYFMTPDFFRFIIVALTSVGMSVLCIYFIGLTGNERQLVTTTCTKLMYRNRNEYLNN